MLRGVGGGVGGSLSYYQYFQPVENTKLQKDALPATVKRRKLARFEHVTRHDSLFNTILQGTLEDGRRRGQQRKCWMDNIKSEHFCSCQNCSQGHPEEKDWKRISAESSVIIISLTSQSVRGLH